ncbi:hypothetical protein HGB07_00200, partial [Candidatus Roizmanbacteria bacterium]|nr:hypothetical protein [Candidatus Roizmanbacteria bacterium]
LNAKTSITPASPYASAVATPPATANIETPAQPTQPAATTPGEATPSATSGEKVQGQENGTDQDQTNTSKDPVQLDAEVTKALAILDDIRNGRLQMQDKELNHKLLQVVSGAMTIGELEQRKVSAASDRNEAAYKNAASREQQIGKRAKSAMNEIKDVTTHKDSTPKEQMYAYDVLIAVHTDDLLTMETARLIKDQKSSPSLDEKKMQQTINELQKKRDEINSANGGNNRNQLIEQVLKIKYELHKVDPNNNSLEEADITAMAKNPLGVLKDTMSTYLDDFTMTEAEMATNDSIREFRKERKQAQNLFYDALVNSGVIDSSAKKEIEKMTDLTKHPDYKKMAKVSGGLFLLLLFVTMNAAQKKNKESRMQGAA